ncbi:hypothetical protein GALMADRAFT_258387 [Galerina marginata CBS 339.88]|uniref:Uncharacterized protein n=1 Tax=Galerina marginata (strain CBS 339.88) TaxID=685588 RepID=A0A067S9E0_GALM3|nr:hypothetical protein GALMADRAFT_258387 [Galerina marginata CBS 339.88]
MPRLTHLSVVAADFGYAGDGFRRFFEVHGWRIVQLELGHSSGEVEEAWVTGPGGAGVGVGANGNGNGNGNGNTTTSPADPFSIPLNAWCPALKEFICSADAEWNWQSPDWIAPHVLLPSHSGLTFIGVRDMERRLVGDADDAARRRRENQGLAQYQGQGLTQGQAQEEDPYFMLLEQFGSLLREDAFPALRFVRDMSWESDVIRRTGRMCPVLLAGVDLSAGGGGGGGAVPRWLPSSSQPPSPSPSSGFSSPFSGLGLGIGSSSNTKRASRSRAARAQTAEETQAHAGGQRVLRFWAGVLERCRARGVWLEDWRGVNVRVGDLRRAGG